MALLCVYRTAWVRSLGVLGDTESCNVGDLTAMCTLNCQATDTCTLQTCDSLMISFASQPASHTLWCWRQGPASPPRRATIPPGKQLSRSLWTSRPLVGRLISACERVISLSSLWRPGDTDCTAVSNSHVTINQYNTRLTLKHRDIRPDRWVNTWPQLFTH